MDFDRPRATQHQVLISTLIHHNLSLDDWLEFRQLSAGGSDWLLPAFTTLHPPGNATSPYSPSSSWILCDAQVRALRDLHRPVYGYTCLLLCSLGAVFNLINMMVLTRRDMVSPTNAILTGLALADTALMIEYIPFSVVHHLLPRSFHFTHASATYILFHAHFSQVAHTLSVWMTLLLASWRYLIVVLPNNAVRVCSMHRALKFVLLGFVVAPLLCITSLLSFVVRSRPVSSSHDDDHDDDDDGRLQQEFHIGPSLVGGAHNELLVRISFWLHSVMVKLGPCVALIFLMTRMISVLLETRRRKQRLRNHITSGDDTTATLREVSRLNGTSPRPPGMRQVDRTTWMLVAILLLFLITEIPQGVMSLLAGLSTDFRDTCYATFGDLMDVLALVNSFINFPLYCMMSMQFRNTLRRVMGCEARAEREQLHLASHNTAATHCSKNTETGVL